MDRSPKMNRGGSYGGGQSSLGYLFGGGAPPDNDKQNKRNETAPPSPIYAPPYGIDSDVDNTTVTKPPPPPNSPGNTFDRILPQNSGNFTIANRPSTKVKSAPGGDSSLGYLFGDKI